MTEEENQMIQDCIRREGRLGDWERNFIDSLEVRGEPLTSKQHDKLTQIWERVT